MVEEVICDLRLATSGSFGPSMEEQRSVPENTIGWKKTEEVAGKQGAEESEFLQKTGRIRSERQ